jgi:hypothetical protein
MNITITGANVSQRKYILSAIEYCVNKLMPRMTNIDIYVKLKDIKDGEAMGYCLADPEGDAERNDRPRVFELEIHKKLPLRKLLETICHEMVHVKQYARGELYEGSRVSKHRWQGKWIQEDPDYWDQPWEIEAMGREAGLFIRWVESQNLANKKWTQID